MSVSTHSKPPIPWVQECLVYGRFYRQGLKPVALVRTIPFLESVNIWLEIFTSFDFHLTTITGQKLAQSADI